MGSDLVISARNLGKTYRIWGNPTARLASPFWQGMAGLLPPASKAARALLAKAGSYYEDFHALQGVSFEVRRGESLGIIGRNGAGKSSLLQLIAGTLQPSEGSVEVNGRVAALLELGSGFNPDFTGRDNVYLNATVLGLSRRQIDERYDAIAAFAEIGDFIDRQVSTYSSGMVMRLAFAVAAHVDPDILIVDEALSVGDARFQLKCARAIDRFVAQGVTLLFVSHDSSMVKRLCKEALLLERGRVVHAGRPNDVVNLYSKLIADGGSVEALAGDLAALRAGRKTGIQATALPGVEAETRPGNATAAQTDAALALLEPANEEIKGLRLRLRAMETLLASHSDDPLLGGKVEALLAEERLHVQVSGQEFAYGGKSGRITEVSILDSEDHARTWFTTGENVTVRMVAEAEDDYPEPIFALTVKNVAGVEIYGTNTLFSKQFAAPMKAGDRREVTFSFELNLMPGAYFLSFGFTHFVGEELVVAHRRYDAIKIDVHSKDRTFGIANLKAVIRSQDLPRGP